MMNSSQDRVKARKKAANRAGHSSGTVTSSSTCHSAAPRSRAARSIRACASPIWANRIAKHNGRLITTWPMPTASSERGTPSALKVTSRPMPMIR